MGRRTKRRWRVGAMLAAAVLCPALAWPAAATESETTPEVPADVVEWLNAEGAEAVSPEQVPEGAIVTLGAPRPVVSWSEEFRAGTGNGPQVVARDQWAVPVLAESDGSTVPFQTIVVERGSDGSPELANVGTDRSLAEGVDRLSAQDLLVYDSEGGGWYAMDESRVWPLDAEARDHLRGAVPTSLFQDQSRAHGEFADGDAAAGDGGEGVEVLSPTIVALAATGIAGAIVVVMLMRGHRRTDARIAEEVTASVSPPGRGGSTSA